MILSDRTLIEASVSVLELLIASVTSVFFALRAISSLFLEMEVSASATRLVIAVIFVFAVSASLFA